MKRWYAVSAVLSLAGTSHGFIVNYFEVPAGGAITPSSGAFANYTGESLLLSNLVIQDSRGLWRSYWNYVFGTSWLAADPRGGGVDIDGYDNNFSRVLIGPGADPTVPLFASSNSSAFSSYPGGFLDDGSALIGGSSGSWWGPDTGAMASEVSPVNGVSIDSVFFGYFVMTDPGAVLTGTELMVRIGGVDYFLPIDGSVGPLSGGYSIAYEEYPVSSPFLTGEAKAIKAFVVVPAPWAAGPLGIGVIGLTFRRRR